MSPEISIITPMWNSAATIEATLASLRAQSMDDWESIVVDDGSTDSGPALAQRIAAADVRVRVHTQANAGLAAARNSGLGLAKGRFVLFLDADDTLPPDSLATLRAHAEAHGGAAFGAFAWREPEETGESFEVETSCREAGLHELLECNRFPVHAQMIARDLLGAERFDPSLASAEDWDLWLRLAARGVRWSGVDRVVAHYHLTPGSMSRDDARMLDAMGLVARSAFAAARRDARNDCDASRERERRVRTRLAVECATGASLSDPTPRADSAGALLRALQPTRGEVTAQGLAVAAYWVLPHAARRTPRAWGGMDKRWLGALDRLWSRCEAEGWTEPGARDVARGALAELLVDPERVSEELARRARRAGCIELLGFGRNGRRIARTFLREGIPFSIRDDAIAPGWIDFEGCRIAARPVKGEFASGACAVVSVADAAPLIAALPRTVEQYAWSVVRRELASEAHAALRDAWPARAARERAA